MLYEAKWTQAARDAYHAEHPERFAGPHKSFPIKDANDVKDAYDMAGQADDPDTVRAAVIRIAREMGLTHALPATANQKQESAASVVDAGSRPRKKIGTLKVRWLSYGARSLNGRIYPKATCDLIFEAAKRKVVSNDLPATVFVSHEAANTNGNMELVGRVVKVWQEGSDFYALLDLADTRAAWDMLALAEGGYLRSESMRVAGVELRHDNGYDLPLVMPQEGTQVEFLGIDLTTRPGLADSARILQTLYESVSQQSYMEVFALENCTIESREDPPAMTIPIYVQIALGMLQEDASKEAHMRVHDHLAGVMDECFGSKHGSESARYRSLVESQLDEAGRAIAMKHAARLAAAHDESAKVLGMKCEGCYKEAFAPSDTDHDGDNPAQGNDPDNDGESAGKDKILTEQEMLAALAAKGYAIQAPKTPADELAELKAQIAEQNKKIQQLTEQQPTQRQTFAPSLIDEQSPFQPEQLYEDGSLIRGDLKPQNWGALSDRRVPWPHDKIDPKQALHELAPFLVLSTLTQEAASHGKHISQYVGPNEDI